MTTTSPSSSVSSIERSQAATRGRRLRAQTWIELLLTLRRAESLLLTFAIPVLLLVFFTKVDLLGLKGNEAVNYLYPGIVALAVLSTAMVSLAIATGFERSTGVLKRLAVTPLRRGELLAAKTFAIVGIEILQISLLTLEGLALGWRPAGVQFATLVGGIVLGTIAFAGLGLLLAGTLPALTTLAAANGLYLILLLLGGVIVPIDHFPTGFQPFVKFLPATALSDICRGSLNGVGAPTHAWIVLVVWAVVTPVLAARFFRWD